MSKVIAHYELFKMVQDLPGAIVECGLFKGVSFVRFAMLRSLFGNVFSKKMIGFDVFGPFPETRFEQDKKMREKFIRDAGLESISKEQLLEVFRRKGLEKNVELIEGDVCETVPEYVRNNPELKISLLNLDTDIYEPAVVILEHLWPRIVKGGILLLDDYGIFPGETKAADEYFNDKNAKIKKLSFSVTPCYVVKE
jgi:hypothetical protein